VWAPRACRFPLATNARPWPGARLESPPPRAAIRDARARGLPDNSEAMVNMVRAALAPRYGTWSQFGPWLPENIEGLTRLGFTR
jgi:hypothetical protein